MTRHPKIPAKLKAAKVGDPVWHCHHNTLIEPLSEPAEIRWNHIIDFKAATEVPTRLRLFRPVLGKLPSAVVKARAELDKASAELDKARAKWDKARAGRVRAIRDNMPAILKLHAKECPNCPWNGKTIFP